MSIKSQSLFYRDSKSDKVYLLQIEKDRDGYNVFFQYGRRGQSLTSGSKCKIPVSLNEAEVIFSDLLVSKLAKGYTPDKEGAPFSQTENAGKVSGLVPQLLNPIDEEQIEQFLSDDRWVMQEKKDGVRLMIQSGENDVVGSNRRGLVIPLPAKIHDAVRYFTGPGSATLDGEAIGDTFFVFDMLEWNGADLRKNGFLVRGNQLLAFVDQDIAGIINVPFYTSEESKRKALAALKKDRAEGVVFKLFNAPYIPGRPNSGGSQVKFKFVSSATCEVISVTEGKRSVEIAVHEPIYGHLVSVGRVTIPANHVMPCVPQKVEVRYLYAYPGGSLYQPVYIGPRPDKNRADLENSLKFKKSTDEEDS